MGVLSEFIDMNKTNARSVCVCGFDELMCAPNSGMTCDITGVILESQTFVYGYIITNKSSGNHNQHFFY